MTNKKFYITTAIDYVNAKPHIGHAFEKVLADAIARHHRQSGERVWFLTGVDENAQKNVQAAERVGIPVKEFIDRNAGFFIKLCKELNLSHDDFIRTTSKQHSRIVQEIVRKIIKKGDIYRSKYTGLYCIGCETYYTEKDLVDGKCPEHKIKPEERTEEAFFFRLSKYKAQLLKLIPKYVTPITKANEIISRIKEHGLNDVCISRKGAKWGIDFPDNKNFKIWVWIDALINYITASHGNWPADLHIVGKGINWFHSVIWPAILLSAGYELPKKLLVHGYLNIEGEKISKSLGNVIDPLELIKKYGTDSVRYSLLRCSVFEDSDYSEEILIKRHNNELADKLGNLVSRVAALAEKIGIEKSENKLHLSPKHKKAIVEGKVELKIEYEYPEQEIWHRRYLLKEIEKGVLDGFNYLFGEHPTELGEIIPLFVERYFNEYKIDKALETIFLFIDYCNWCVQIRKPWETHDKKILYELVESIRQIAKLLWPFIPETSGKISKQFKNDKIKKAEILFKKI